MEEEDNNSSSNNSHNINRIIKFPNIFKKFMKKKKRFNYKTKLKRQLFKIIVIIPNPFPPGAKIY